jgi:hypothetical protein
MLALHLVAAFAVAAALTLFSVMVFAGRRMTTLDETRALFRIGPFGGILINAGIGLVLLLGIILAIDSDQFEIWDGWVIAAIVLWAILGGVGQRSGAYYTAIQKLAEEGNESEVLARLRASTGVLLHSATVGVFLLIVLDMIFKPGA